MSGRSPTALAVTMGDPCGIGPEILVKALARADLAAGASIVVVGDARVIEAEARRQGVCLALAPFGEGSERPAAALSLLAASGLDLGRLTAGKPDREGAQASLAYVRHAADLAARGLVAGIVTCPVSKQAIREVDPAFLGHTEFLGDLSGAPGTVMLFCAGDLRVAVATTHIAFAEVPRALTAEGILETLVILHRGLVEDFGVATPRIAVAALNPHGGEGGAFGDEEKRILEPAIAKARAAGVDAAGPFPADTLFVRLKEREFDVVLALYHDQGMIPVKLEGFRRAVNVTLGLPFVRTSVAHGTAWEIAGRGRASEASLVEAIRLASRLAAKRAGRRC